MANQVDARRDPFRPGDRIDTGAPLSPDVATRLTAIAVVPDPQLGEIATVNGRVRFLQAVGLTADELELARRWRTSGVVAALAKRDPLLLTALDRPSLLEEPDVRARLEAQARSEGPS
jgi:suppressor of fused-like protein